jgi:peptidoglycan/xylan/chitin deacetylase (PgdA/CDA1 family)
MTFTMDVEGEDTYVNARDVAAAFRNDGVPITFFAVTGLVGEDQALAEALIAAGEVGSQTVDHSPLYGLTAQAQSLRLQRAWRDVESWTGIAPAGLRPPEERFDSLTVQAWSEAGGRYLVANNEARTGAPSLYTTTGEPLVLVPRLIKDDYDIVVRDVTVRSVGLASGYLAGVRKMRAIGGVAVVAGHTQIISNGPRLEAMRAVADTALAQGDWWVTRADELAGWWLSRSGVRLHWESGEAAESRARLVVRGPEAGDVSELWLDVVDPTIAPDLVPFVDGVSVNYLDEPWGMRVRVGTVPAGQERRVSFESVPDDEPSQTQR